MIKTERKYKNKLTQVRYETAKEALDRKLINFLDFCSVVNVLDAEDAVIKSSKVLDKSLYERSIELINNASSFDDIIDARQVIALLPHGVLRQHLNELADMKKIKEKDKWGQVK